MFKQPEKRCEVGIVRSTSKGITSAGVREDWRLLVAIIKKDRYSLATRWELCRTSPSCCITLPHLFCWLIIRLLQILQVRIQWHSESWWHVSFVLTSLWQAQPLLPQCYASPLNKTKKSSNPEGGRFWARLVLRAVWRVHSLKSPISRMLNLYESSKIFQRNEMKDRHTCTNQYVATISNVAIVMIRKSKW